jgi:hypothetical protein
MQSGFSLTLSLSLSLSLPRHPETKGRPNGEQGGLRRDRHAMPSATLQAEATFYF